LKQAAEATRRRARSLRLGKGTTNLADDVALTHHEGSKAATDSKEMLRYCGTGVVFEQCP
jgi:hypothetical protein